MTTTATFVQRLAVLLAICLGAAIVVSGQAGGSAPLAGSFPVFGETPFSAGGTGGNGIRVRNTTAGTGNFARMVLQNDASTTLSMKLNSTTYTASGVDPQDGGVIGTDGAGGLNIFASNGSGVICWFTGGTTKRFCVNAAGDHTVGASAHLMDSVGTPSVVVHAPVYFNGGAANGSDYAFTVNNGSSTGGGITTDGVVNFGHTFSTAPVCTVTTTTGNSVGLTTTTTQLTLTAVTAGAINMVWNVLCRGY